MSESACSRVAIQTRPTLHDARLVGRKLDVILSDLDVDFVGEGNTLQQLLNWSCGAGDRAKDGPCLSAIGRRHDVCGCLGSLD